MTAATNTTLGEIKLAGDLAGNNNALAPELSPSGVTAGVYTNPNITVNAKGLITSVASGSNVDIFNIPDAAPGIKGVVTIGSGVNVAAGVISIPVATDTTLGVVKIGTGLLVSAGVVTIDSGLYITYAAGGTFGGSLATTIVDSSVTGSVTLDFEASNVFHPTLTGNITLNIPTNVPAGGVYWIVFTQDATGGRTCTFNAAYKFESGSPTTLSTGANAVDLMRIVVVSGTEFLCKLYRNFV